LLQVIATKKYRAIIGGFLYKPPPTKLAIVLPSQPFMSYGHILNKNSKTPTLSWIVSGFELSQDAGHYDTQNCATVTAAIEGPQQSTLP
jgi:hypothetical protein